ncbi:MAG TPA: DinB family protein [Rhodothermales bacterium]|nr:DinB family protein [Rhodothermales bacterium]
MREVDRIAEQLARIFEGDAWHGPSLSELLGRVNAEDAAYKPSPDVHSIWEIIRHVTVWHRAVVLRIRGEAIDYEGAEDWPPVHDTEDSSWGDVWQDLRLSYVELYDTIRLLPENRLDERVVGKDYTIAFMLLGVIEHDTYHGGQVALLAKLARARRG